MSTSRHISLHELAQQTNLPKAWLQREADAGRLPCIRAESRRMFKLDAVLKALAERQEGEVARGR